MTGHPLPPKLTGTDQVGLHAAELIDDDLGISIGKGPDSRVAGLSSKPRQRPTFASVISCTLSARKARSWCSRDPQCRWLPPAIP
jgi:hypothetical protein